MTRHLTLFAATLLGCGALYVPALVPLAGVAAFLCGFFYSEWLQCEDRQWMAVRRDRELSRTARRYFDKV